eukprot:jgi/Mesvir1/17461/Mv26482-RA.1
MARSRSYDLSHTTRSACCRSCYPHSMLCIKYAQYITRRLRERPLCSPNPAPLHVFQAYLSVGSGPLGILTAFATPCRSCIDPQVRPHWS